MPFLGEFISLGTALCWTITVISFEYAGKRVGAISVNYIRLIIGFLALGILLYFTTGTFIPIDATGHAWLFLTISGFIGLVIGDLFLFQSFVDVGGRISLLIMSMSPPLTALLSFLFLQETLSEKDLIGMVITIGAIIFVISQKRGKENISHPHVIRGIIFAIIGAVGQSVGLIFSKVGMGDYNAFAATQIRIIAAIIGFSIFVIFSKRLPNVKKAIMNKNAMIFIFLGSIFGPFLGVSSQLFAMQYTQIGVATTIAQINVILIIPFSIILFKEKVSIKEIIGSIVAFAGVALMFL